MNVMSYTASGGGSALLMLPSGEQVRVEAHVGDYAVTWPTILGAGDLLTAVQPLLPTQPPRVSLAGDWDPPRPTLVSLADHLITGSVEYFRLDYPAEGPEQITLTWTERRRVAERSEHLGFATHEVGFSAQAFDSAHLANLLQTSTVSVRDATAALMQRIEPLLERYPRGMGCVRGAP